MSAGHRLLKFTRQLHLYLGVFTAPMLLFFAVTGGLQTFGWHEAARDGSGYRPPAWLASLSMLHKKQTTVAPARRPRPEAAGAERAAAPTADAQAGTGEHRPPAGAEARPPRTPPRHLLPMKIFFVLVSLGLLLSTLTGVYMAYRFTRRPRLVSALLAAGVAVPVLLALL
ncbi:hypothetical protein [Fulvimonas soli]|uniref:PepSY-associated transmembrane protein n=1 Tax=Fulvimonas soli TaxID=155197 RepID=A0A316I509_9GAMM|nr:hypothetical protein [Fulvimonas soli]PWK87787.1 hypothetical protein C7456_106280 [Fulvimonas soli]